MFKSPNGMAHQICIVAIQLNSTHREWKLSSFDRDSMLMMMRNSFISQSG